jgi:thioredoxin-related protein
MKRISVGILTLMLVLIGSTAFTQENEGVKVNWLSFEEAVEKSKTEKRKIFIDVYTSWCGWCKVMDKNTFSQPIIAEYLNENFYAVKLNAEQKEDIFFRDHTFKFIASGNRGYHELAASLLSNKMSYPSVVFLDENFNIIQPLAGYLKPDRFEMIVKFIGGDNFKTVDWQTWEGEFVSSFE